MKTPISLWGFTILAGAGAGLALAAALLKTQSSLAVPIKGTLDPVWLCLAGAVVLTALGGVAAVAHLERPWGGHRVLNNWRTSWLSREVIVEGVFGATLVLAMGVGEAGWAVWLAAAVGVAGVFTTGLLYGSIRAIRGWFGHLTPQLLLGLGSASGLALAGTGLAGMGYLPEGRLLFQYAAIFTGISLGLALGRQGSLGGTPTLGGKDAPFPWHHSGKVKVIDRGTTYLSAHTKPQLTFTGKGSKIQSIRTEGLLLLGTLGIPFLLFAFLTTGACGSGQIITDLMAGGATIILFGGIGLERWRLFAGANHVSGAWI